ncbi:MAG TPA: hypothetical protein VKH81_07175 [Candidatus Angelobacter sp.]|nr:hypothetical protein [Candidatus Angelobacter sp.]
MSAERRYISSVLLLAMFLLVSARLRGQEEASPDKVFAAVPFDRWVQQGAVTEIPWKVRITPLGLTVYQRLRARIDVELEGRDLLKFPAGDRLAVLVQVSDAAGRKFREYQITTLKELPHFNKTRLDVYWNLFVVPGEYQVTLAVVETVKGRHSLMQAPMRVEPLKNDLLPGSWEGLPTVEFLTTGLREPDVFFHPDATGRLHLPLQSRRDVRLEVLADVTASDLFRGSTAFYNRYLAVALPLLKSLSQVTVERGSLDVAMLDLRKRAVTFEQDDVKALDWPKARSALAPETGPSTIDIKELEKRRESPAFLQDELLRRLTAAPADQPRGDDPAHVFVIIGSPMDFYSFRNLPHLPPGSEEKCVVYYLQFELLNTTYANGAVGNVRKMLAPLPVHVFKVRSAESVRYALAKILNEVKNM